MTASSTNYESDQLVVSVARSGRVAIISWTGESDSRNPGAFLNPLMARLVKEFAGLDVTIDFSSLNYMNSATVTPLIVASNLSTHPRPTC